MKKHVRIFSLAFILLLSMFMMFGCDTKTDDTTEETEETEESTEETPEVIYQLIDSIAVSDSENLKSNGLLLSSFKISDIKLTIYYVEDTEPAYVEIPVTLNMVKAEDKAKLTVTGEHTIHLIYGKFTTSFVLKLYAETSAKCKIIFMDDEGNRVGDIQYLEQGQIAVVPNLKTKEGYDFVGWKIQNTDTVVSSYIFTTDTTLVAYYEPTSYWVEFCYKINDLEYAFSDGKNKVSVPKGEDAYDYAPELPVLKGFKNAHWENRDGMKNVHESGLKFTAVYEKEYVDATFVYYKFESPQGEEDSLYEYKVYWKVGEATEGINAPDDVEKSTKRIFLYWYIKHDGKKIKVTFPYVLTAETVFYAEYVDVYTGTEGLVYQEIEGKQYISGYNGDSDVIAIPTMHEGKNVVGLIDNPFYGKKIRRYYVTNDNEVFRIYKEALYSADLKTLYAYPCEKEETSFVVENEKMKVETIYDYAFYGAEKLTSIVIPETVTSIGKYAFYGCKGIENIILPNEVASIGDYGFAEAEKLKTIEISEKSLLERMGSYVFYNDVSLQSFFVPYHLSVLGKGCWMGCLSLEKINISDGQTDFTVENGCLYGKLGNNSYYYLYAYPALYSGIAKSGLVVLNNSTQYVLTGAFYYCSIAGISYTNGASVSLEFEENSVVCPTLQALVFSSEQPNFNENAFGENRYLPDTVYFASRKDDDKDDDFKTYLMSQGLAEENIICQESTSAVTYKNDGGYYYILSDGKAYIKSYRGKESTVTIPEKLDNTVVAGIEEYAFSNNVSLTEVIFSQNIESVGYKAFYGCPSLTTVHLNGKILRSIGDYAFADCPCLTTVQTETDTRITEFGFLPFHNDPVTQADLWTVGGVLVSYNGNDEVFTMPDGVYTVADYAFLNASALSTVLFTKNSLLTSIHSYAFSGCTALTDMSIPEKVTYIGSKAFDGCKSLFALVVSPSTATEQDSYENAGSVYGGTQVLLYSQSKYSYYFDEQMGEGFYIIDAPEGDKGFFFGWYTDEECKNIASFPCLLDKETHFYSLYVEEEETDTSGFTFQKTNGGYEVVSYSGSDAVVSIPSLFRGEKVVGIGENAITSSSCLSVIFPSTICYVRKNALLGSGFLTNYKGETVIVGHVLIAYNGLQKKFTFPQNVTVIADDAFAGNDTLEEVYFTSAISTVPEGCFRNCETLKNVYLNGQTAMKAFAFEGCESLSVLTFEKASGLQEIDKDAFTDSAWVVNYVDDCIVINDIFYCYLGGNDILHIPGGVKTINPYAFYGNKTLQYVYISESVEVIGKYAFAETNIKKIFYPSENNHVKTIEEYAFFGCHNVSDIDIRNCSALTSIGEGAFAEVWSSGEKIVFYIPAKVESIGKNAFASSMVSTVQFEADSRLESIPEGCFEDCNDLLSVSFLGDSDLERIEQNAFYGCVSLSSFYNTDCAIEYIGERAFYGCERLTAFHISEGFLQEVGTEAFDMSGYLDGSETMAMLGTVLLQYNGISSEVHIPKGTTVISNSAFADNDRMESVLFDGTEIKTIQEFAFKNCTQLEKITLPSSITSVFYGSFAGCSSLTTIEIELTDREEGYVSVTGILYRYYVENEKKVAELVAFPNKRAKKYQIPKEITVRQEKYEVIAVCDYAFYGCDNLEQVTFEAGSKVKYIGKEAFRYCTGITEFSLPSSLLEVGDGAFAGCVAITRYTASSEKYYANGDLYYIGSTEGSDEEVAVLWAVADAATTADTYTVLQEITVNEKTYEVSYVHCYAFENSHFEKIIDSLSIIPADSLVGFEGSIEE